MPATVRINDSSRTTLRALIIIAAAIVLVIPLAITTAHAASRLNFGKVELSDPLPTGMEKLKLDVETGAAVRVRSSDFDKPTVTLTATGPRSRTPSFDINTEGSTTVVSFDEPSYLENARVTVNVPEALAQKLEVHVDGGYGTVDTTGNFRNIVASTDGGMISVDGTVEHLDASTDWGAISLNGSYSSLEARTDTGVIEGSELTVRDRVNVKASTGAITLDFSDDAVPVSGITAQTDEGMIDVGLPKPDLVPADGANGGADESVDSTGGTTGQDSGKAKDVSYSISATSDDGTVDIDRDLKPFDVARDPDAAKTMTVVPVSATTETGMITLGLN